MSTTLDRVPYGTPVRVAESQSPPELARRLAELGVRPGAVVRCLHSTAGGGRVLDVAGARIAVGRTVLRAVSAEPVAP